MDGTRREILNTVTEWVLGGVIGNYVYDFYKTSVLSPTKEVANKPIEKLLGTIVRIPVWTGSEMLGVEFEFLWLAERGYVFHGRRIYCSYQDGARCAELSKDLIQTCIAMKDLLGLRFEVDLSEVDWGGRIPD